MNLSQKISVLTCALEDWRLLNLRKHYDELKPHMLDLMERLKINFTMISQTMDSKCIEPAKEGDLMIMRKTVSETYQWYDIETGEELNREPVSQSGEAPVVNSLNDTEQALHIRLSRLCEIAFILKEINADKA